MYKMYLKDDRVFVIWSYAGQPERDDGLVISRYDLAFSIDYINTLHAELLEVTLCDPRLFVDRAYFEAHMQRVQSFFADHLNKQTLPRFRCKRRNHGSVCLLLWKRRQHAPVIPCPASSTHWSHTSKLCRPARLKCNIWLVLRIMMAMRPALPRGRKSIPG